MKDDLSLPDEFEYASLPDINIRCGVPCLHFFRDACDDVVGKCLDCGTAHQQLPRSPTSEILQPRWKLLSQAPRGIQRRSTTEA
jgi:hypothetical protein